MAQTRSKLKLPIAIIILLLLVGAGISLSDGSFSADVFAWYPDGQVRNLSPTPHGKYYEPQVHPLGQDVIFFGNATGVPRIWRAGLTDGAVMALTPDTFSSRQASYSWDGKLIVFASDEGLSQPLEDVEVMGKDGTPPPTHHFNLFIINADGSDRRRITKGSFQDQRPCFSPDGKTIAFVSNRGGGTQLWTVPADGSQEPAALQTQGYGYRPSYSVDGQWIYFFSAFGARHQICRIPAKGGAIEPLANDTLGMSHGPFALPGGQSLLMHSYACGGYAIWELPLDGKPPRPAQPPGFAQATHATRSQNGITTFDVAENRSFLRRLGADLKRRSFAWRGCQPVLAQSK